ncbi:MAG: hypothetical protein HYZ28_19340 [Myxococcales bacterium]|nr:hypothetical protein [Myxococcales bacterium]
MQPWYCKLPGELCASSSDCCTGLCASGSCSAQRCQDVGAICSSDGECCTLTCTGTCTSIPGQGGCKVLGQACLAGSECCSTNCKGGYCTPAYACRANGDLCTKSSDCCGNACSVNDGGAGYCLVVTGGGGGGCLQDGNPCGSGGTNCCSRTCTDLGAGAPVCLPASGCRLTGNFCLATSQCCGGAPNPNQSVTCDPVTSRCDNGTSCNGVGNICGATLSLPDGGSVNINASQNCCDGKKAVCKLDSSGIPRCFGGCPNDTCDPQCPTGYTGIEPCCIAVGGSCQFRDQCCGRSPCLPDPDGGAGFICIPPPKCLPLGGSCVMGADGGQACCPGTSCLPALGGADACQLGGPPDAGSTDAGGTADAGGPVDAGCKVNGEPCSSAPECCSLICGSTDGGPATCQTPVVCQPQGGVCTATSDCCTGQYCNIPSGSTTGTCQPGTCPGTGQSCSPFTPCCSGLQCLDGAGFACSGATACTCAVIVN